MRYNSAVKHPKNTAKQSPDDLLLPVEAAKRAKMELRPFMANVRKRKIPCIRINARVFRFHWPSVLEALQK